VVIEIVEARERKKGILSRYQEEALVNNNKTNENTSNIGQFIFIVAPYVSDHHDKSLSASQLLIIRGSC
jgi:hypothetical protein